MSESDNWRIQTNATDYLGQQKKRESVADRRPVIRRASDLVGPGIAQDAVRITDFNNTLATFNGFFSAAEDTPNAPEDTHAYVGFVSSDAELGGVQQFTSIGEDALGNVCYRRTFRRNPYNPSTVYWSSWVEVASVAYVDAEVTAHKNDGTDAHNASAISYSGVDSTLSADNVKEALDELDAEKD